MEEIKFQPWWWFFYLITRSRKPSWRSSGSQYRMFMFLVAEVKDKRYSFYEATLKHVYKYTKRLRD